MLLQPFLRRRSGTALRSFWTTWRTFWKCLSSRAVSTKSDASLTPRSAPSFTTFAARTFARLAMCASFDCYLLTGRGRNETLSLQAIDREPRIFSNEITQTCCFIDDNRRKFWFAPSSTKAIQWSLQVTSWLNGQMYVSKGFALWLG